MKYTQLLLSVLYIIFLQHLSSASNTIYSSLAFIENKGQYVTSDGAPASHVLFKTKAPGIDIFITTNGISYMFSKTETVTGNNKEKKSEYPSFPTCPDVQWNRLDMILKNASIKKENVITERKQITGYNYYLGHCAKGILNVYAYEKLIITNVYPGIDWHIYTKENNKLKYDFVVHPNADPGAIKIVYEGAMEMAVSDNNNITIKTAIGEINENNLYCYNQYTGNKVAAVFKIDTKNNAITFNLGDYDHSQTLVIDPDLVWGTYFGGSLIDFPSEIMADASGNVYVIGSTGSLNLPVTNPGGTTYYQGTHQQGSGGPISGVIDMEAFVAKFDTKGILLWCTYYGGSTGQEGFSSMAINSAGDIYIAGGYGHGYAVRPNPLPPPHNFPLQNTAGAYFRNPVLGSGDMESTIIQLDNNGVRKWASFYGGSGYDWVYDICIDKNDNIYMIGRTGSTDLPIVNPGGGAHMSSTQVDVYIAKFSSSNQLIWSTHWGGSTLGVHTVYCTTDQNNNFIIAGTTDSPDLPLVNPGGGAYYNNIINPPVTVGGAMVMFDIFIAKFTPAGVPFWGTYYGGNGQDEGYALCTDLQNNIYVTGYSGYTLPLNTPNTFQTYNPGGGAYYDGTWQGGGADLAILKFDQNGVRQWVTYYSGTTPADEIGGGIMADAAGNIYINGSTSSVNFPAVNTGCGFLQSVNASQDITNSQEFILQFSPSLTVEWSTYYGGIGRHNGNFDNGMATDGAGNLYLTTMFQGPNCPLFDPGNGAYYQPNNAGDFDAVILKFAPKPVVTASGDTTVCSGSNVILTASGTLSYAWNTGSTGSSMSLTPSSSATVSVIATNNLCSDTAVININVIPNPVASISGNSVICPGDSSQLTASGGINYLWNTTSTNNSITVRPTSSGTYTVVAFNGICTDTATFSVNVNSSITAQVSGTGSICYGESATLSASGGTSFIWNNGATQSVVTVSPSSSVSYSVIVSSGNCADTTSFTVNVNVLPVINISNDTAICAGNNVTLFASGGIVYNWSNGINTGSIIVSPPLTSLYTVTVSNGACSDIASVNVIVNPLPVANAGADQRISAGTPITLNGSGGTTYLWSPANGLSCSDCANPTANPQNTSTYMLTVTDANGCSSVDEITIIVDVICDELFIPNAFSPNGDGQNDVFRVMGNCFKTFQLDIYNQWGERIFSSTTQDTPWTGYYKEILLNTDVFVYKIQGELLSGDGFSKEGNITLLR